MINKTIKTITTLLVVVSITLNGCKLSTQNPIPQIDNSINIRASLMDKNKRNIYLQTLKIPKPKNCKKAKVTKIIDGDSIQINNNQTVRLIGIDSPETVHSTKSVQFYGKQASSFLKKLLDNEQICITKDSLNENKDQYGRLLRYVRKDNIQINAKMLLFGYAKGLYRFPFEYKDFYKKIEQQAKNSHLGVHNFAKKEKFQSNIQNEKQKANRCKNKKNIICAHEAYKYIGTSQTIRFFVSNPVPSQNHIYLNSNKNRDTKTNFAVLIEKDPQKKFNKNTIYKFANKAIQVKGKLIKKENHTQLKLKNKNQIKIID